MSLVKTYPQNSADILVRAKKYMRMEDIFTQEEILTTSTMGGKKLEAGSKYFLREKRARQCSRSSP